MPDAPRRSRRAPVRLTVSLGTLVVSLAAADVWVGRRYLADGEHGGVRLPPYSRLTAQERAAIGERAEQLERLERDKTLGAYDQQLGWDYLPGTGWKGREQLTINSLGARGAVEFPAEPPPDKVRIACFGESFTYGTDVPDGEDWPAKLARLDPRLEVLNMGVGGYGTDQVLLRMRRDCARLRPRGVLIGYMLENCLRNVNRWRTRLYVDTDMPVAKPRFILDAAGGLELVPLSYASRVEVYRAAASGELAEALAPHEFWTDDQPLLPLSSLSVLYTAQRAIARRAWAPYYADLDSEPMRVTLALLEECYREALASGAEEACVLVFPTHQDLRTVRLGEDPYWRAFVDELRRRGVPCEDTASWLVAREGRLYDGGHFNAQGNDAIAEGALLWAMEVFPR
jgi:lysophospholipase L1-like esterase